MSESERHLSSKVRRRIVLIHSAIPVGFAVVFWIAFVLAAAFEIDVVAILRHRQYNTHSVGIYLALAVLASLVGPVIALIQVRRAFSLARNGMEIEGKVTRVGVLSKSGLVRVECAYTWRGMRFTHAWSHPKDEAKNLSVGDVVPLLVDPKNPNRCMRTDEVFPNDS